MDEETQLTKWGTPKPDVRELARRAGVWIAVLSLAVAVVMFLFAANQLVDIWFRHQYVPMARMVLALMVGGAAMAVIWRLTRSAKSE